MSHSQNKQDVGYFLDGCYQLFVLQNGESGPPVLKTMWDKISSVVVVIDCDNWKLKFYMDGEMKMHAFCLGNH